jgi:hypothetical protein
VDQADRRSRDARLVAPARDEVTIPLPEAG